MNSTEEEKDNSKCLKKTISLFLFYFILFFKSGFTWGREGGWGGYTQRRDPKTAFFKKKIDPDPAFYWHPSVRVCRTIRQTRSLGTFISVRSSLWIILKKIHCNTCSW